MSRNLGLRCGLVLLIVFGKAGLASDSFSVPRRSYGLSDVRVIAVSADLEYLATAGQGGAFVWNLLGTNLLHRLPSDWSVTALAFSPQSNLLLTATSAKITAWNANTGARVQDYVGHAGAINRVHFARDGQSFVSTGDNTARIWSVESGTELRSFHLGSPVMDAALSPDGRKLATIDTFLTNCVKIWDIESESQIGLLPQTNWTAQQCLFTPAGQLLTAAADRSVILWDVETAKPIRAFEGITGAAVAIIDVWMPNDSTVAAACNDGSVFLWNLNSAALLRVVEGEPVVAAAGVPNDHLTVAVHLDYNVRLRQLPGGDTLRTFVGHTTSTHRAAAFSPDGQYVLSAGTEAAARLWDRESGKPVRSFVGSPAGTMAAAFSVDGTKVLTTVGLPNPGVRLWRTETGELEREFLWTGSWPVSASLSRNANRIAGGAQDGRVRIFDTGSGALQRTLTVNGFVNTVDFAPDKPLLAAGSSDSHAHVFNHETGESLATISANGGAVLVVAFSPDGRTLLVGWADGIVRLYDVPAFHLRREFLTAAAFLETAAFSPDGQYILTGEGWPFFTATLWDARTLEVLRTFKGHKWSVGGVGFSADGASIVTGAESVREWSIADLASRVQLEKVNDQVRLTWSYGRLEHAPHINGPWQPIEDATSPFTIPAEAVRGFFRARCD